MMKIFIMTSVFFPSKNGGGPVKSLKNLLENIDDELNTYLVTYGKDVGEEKYYSEVEINKWVQFKNSNIFYLKKFSIFKIYSLIKSVNPDTIYINSFFSKGSIFVYLLLPILKKNKVIIAPRGEFNTNALSSKSSKKIIFINLIKKLIEKSNVKFHATSQKEKDDIEAIFKNEVYVISNLPSLYKNENKRTVKEENAIKIVSISRISKMKNIDFAIETIKNVHDVKIIYDIYGPMEDEMYYEKCVDLAGKTQNNIVINFKGSINNDEISRVLSDYDLFYSPTLGENYGHSIIEAIQNGLPVLISDNTPWINLEQKAIGKEISLDNKLEFTQYIINLAKMNEEQYKSRFYGFESFIENDLKIAETIKQYKIMFSEGGQNE